MEDSDVQQVNINAATAEELASLPGLDPEQAPAVVAYRETYGPFEDAAQIVRVEGIDETIYNIFLQGRIVAGPSVRPQVPEAVPEAEREGPPLHFPTPDFERRRSHHEVRTCAVLLQFHG